MRNRFRKHCLSCGALVEPGEGYCRRNIDEIHTERYKKRYSAWIVLCRDCLKKHGDEFGFDPNLTEYEF